MRHVHAVLVAVVLAAGLLVVDSLVAQSKYSTDPTPGWKVPRTPDGKPDLQGVWGNNSVTPMTRPTQWKDKTDADRRRGRGAEAAVRAATSIRAATRSSATSSSMMLNAKDKGAFEQVSYDPTTGNYNQFWMADREWDNRTSLIIDPPDGQFPPLTAEAQARRAAARREAARARSGGWSRRSAAVGALHLLRRAAHRRQLQQLRADHPVARHRGADAGDDSRRARGADDQPAAPAREASASCTAIRAAAGKATRSSSRPRIT